MNIVSILFTFGFFSTFTLSFLIGTKGLSLSRVVNNIPLNVIEKGVSFKGEDEGISGYFKKEVLENEVKNYLNLSLEGTADKYYISFIYFYLDENSEAKIDLTDYPTKVQIHTEIDYYLNFKVQGYVYFTIGEYIYGY